MKKKILLILFFLFPAHSLWAAMYYENYIKDIKELNSVIVKHINLYHQGVECNSQLTSTNKINKKKCSYFLNNFSNSSENFIKIEKEFSRKYKAKIEGKEFLEMYIALNINQKQRLINLNKTVLVSSNYIMDIAYIQYDLYNKLKKIIKL